MVSLPPGFKFEAKLNLMQQLRYAVCSRLYFHYIHSKDLQMSQISEDNSAYAHRRIFVRANTFKTQKSLLLKLPDIKALKAKHPNKYVVWIDWIMTNFVPIITIPRGGKLWFFLILDWRLSRMSRTFIDILAKNRDTIHCIFPLAWRSKDTAEKANLHKADDANGQLFAHKDKTLLDALMEPMSSIFTRRPV